ncbi:MAG TPA: hypothetical protein VJP02_30300 [Candidatus Sulfotelmatobacter sp.]|nr:hypothetical protein [Candidatus Sulfotelmatobacter sp.]
MKFTEKYELLESLTTGAVETFVANDKVRGERVLVHIVECAPQKPDQTAAEWVLESFRRLAPEPPGLVLETGKYSGAKYAYVVSKPADENVVKAWVRRYELQAEETKETKVHALKREISAPAVAPQFAPPITPKEPSPAPPGQMTQLFRDFDSLAKSKAPEPSIPPIAPPVRPTPSTSLPGGSGLHAADPWDPSSIKAASPPKEPPFTAPPAPIKLFAPESPHPVARDSAKPGEFTSFFQGPFRGDAPSDMPAYSSQPIEPPKKNVGEFTALFGGAPKPPASPVPPSAPGSSFTSVFKDMDAPQPTFNASTPMQGGIVPPPAQALPVSPVKSTATPDPVFASSPPPVAIPDLPVPVTPASPSMPVERPLALRPGSTPGDGATGAFMHPKADPTPVALEAPSGPSPYTQIISRSKLAPGEEAEGGHAPTAGAGAGKFAPPPMPKIPGAAPPPMPKMPKAPPMPKVKVPQAPKAPKIDAPPPPPVSMWPLIITLTVLFFLAVILVLYFVLRH